jgi:hypothetical protein
MVSVNAVDVTRDMLAYTLTNDKGSLIKLLRRNGIEIPADTSDKDVTKAVLLASSKSAVFKTELSALLSSKINEVNKEFENFAGGQFDIGTQEDKAMFTGSDDFFNLAGMPSTAGVGLSDPKFSQAVAKQQAAKQPKDKKKLLGGLFAKKDRTTTATTAGGDAEPKERGRVWAWLGSTLFTPENINAGLNMGLTALNNKIQTKKNEIDYQSELVIDRQQQQIQQQSQRGGVGLGTVVLIVVGVSLLGAMVYFFTRKK